ncbi:MAG: ABC transporter ATP-binding protein [Dongiaceae bacterium]
MSGSAVLRTRGLTRRFSGFAAVDGIDFAVQRHERRAVIGPNGAGKTTFFRLLSGEIPPTAGGIWFEDRAVAGWPAPRLARIGIGKSYQISNGFPNLSVFENLRIAAQPPAIDYRFWTSYRRHGRLGERADELLVTVGLVPQRERLASQLSYGDRRRLELGMALAGDPRLLLLDEPTAGMTPQETEETTELIDRVARGRTVILVEHKMKVVMTLADRISVFHQGRILAEGTPQEIRDNRAVQAVYFGHA